MFKMLGLERSYDIYVQGLQSTIVPPKLRQMFITQSPHLASKVRKYFDKLQGTFAAAQRTPTESLKLAEVERPPEADFTFLHDASDNAYGLGSLPKRFSELQDDHFPLFLTFDQVSSLGTYLTLLLTAFPEVVLSARGRLRQRQRFHWTSGDQGRCD